MPQSYKPSDLHRRARGAMRLADYGVFWTGLEKIERPEGTFIANQSCVEYFIPEELTQQTPVVILHGGGQAVDFLSTADGRPGWVQFLVNKGFAVYLVNQPGTGRAAGGADLAGPVAPSMPCEQTIAMLVAPERASQPYPQAKLHNQWPGEPVVGDPATDAFLASGTPFKVDAERFQRDVVRGAKELIEAIGPTILLTMSAGAIPGWLVADACPQYIRAIAAIEPFGPPVTGLGPMSLPWGLASLPLSYDPPASSSNDLAFEEVSAPRPDLAPAMLQVEPARKLPSLANRPIGIFTAEASWMAADNYATVEFLRQAGCDAEQIMFADHGVTGNGHLVMIEQNSDKAASVVVDWIEKAVQK